MERRKFRVSYLAEQFARQVLANRLGLSVDQVVHLTELNDHAAYDLEAQGLRYDVKYSAPTKISNRKKYKTWDFSLRNKAKGACDYFILVGSVHGVFNAVFLVPESEAPAHHIRITVEGESRWREYQIL